MADREATFGERLRARRDSAGLTQSQLSERCGIPKPTLSRYENDHVQPSLGTLRKLADGLGLSVGALVPDGEQLVERLFEALGRHGIRIRSAAEAERLAELISELVTLERSRQA